MSKFKLTSEKGLIICYAKISGKGKPILLKMALDTGTTKTIIPPMAALGIGINPIHSQEITEIITGSGTEICPIVSIPKFSCLGFTVKKLDIACHALPNESPVEGLLGLDFLKVAKLTLDFPNKIIEFTK